MRGVSTKAAATGRAAAGPRGKGTRVALRSSFEAAILAASNLSRATNPSRGALLARRWSLRRRRSAGRRWSTGRWSSGRRPSGRRPIRAGWRWWVARGRGVVAGIRPAAPSMRAGMISRWTGIRRSARRQHDPGQNQTGYGCNADRHKSPSSRRRFASCLAITAKDWRSCMHPAADITARFRLQKIRARVL